MFFSWSWLFDVLYLDLEVSAQKKVKNKDIPRDYSLKCLVQHDKIKTFLILFHLKYSTCNSRGTVYPN